jgi:hypothetical protein
MFRIRLALLILSVALIPFANAAAPGTEFASANRLFFVELTRTPEKKILISVFHVTNETKAIHWSRAIDWQDEDHGFFSTNVDGVKALVTNDGNTVVLRDNGIPSEKNGIRIIQKSPAKDHHSRPFQRRELTDAEAEERTSSGGIIQRLSREPRRGQMRMHVSYLHVASLLDFFFEEKNSYALWFGQTDQWLLISLTDFHEKIVRDPETLNALNQTAHAMAKALVLQHQPPPLRKMFSSLRNRVADFVPALAAPPSTLYMSGEVSAAYLFLTARHYRSDQSFIEGLIHFEHDGIFHEHGPMRDEIDLHLTPSRGERLIGDYLWSRWNGETNREIISKELYQLLPHDTYRYLGSVAFNLQFPIDVPSTNSGALWFYLVPADEPPAKWDRSSDLITFRSTLGRAFGMGGMRRSSDTLGRTGKATVRGLTPGEYRAKVIWERNPPAGIWRTNAYLGITSDYESIQTEPIIVKAGETVTNISVAITNLIGQASAGGSTR